jgi:hypothetical protein
MITRRHRVISGRPFAKELQRRKGDFVHGSVAQGNGLHAVRRVAGFSAGKKPEFVINAAGYTGKPNVDACELDKAGHTGRQHAVAANHCARLRGGGHSVGACFLGLHFSGAKIFEGQRRSCAWKRHDRAGSCARWLEKSRRVQRFHREGHAELLFSRPARAVFTAAPRRWARRRWPATGKVISGGCAFRLTSLTARAIT